MEAAGAALRAFMVLKGIRMDEHNSDGWQEGTLAPEASKQLCAYRGYAGAYLGSPLEVVGSAGPKCHTQILFFRGGILGPDGTTSGDSYRTQR